MSIAIQHGDRRSRTVGATHMLYNTNRTELDNFGHVIRFLVPDAALGDMAYDVCFQEQVMDSR